jgi:hypothetical protein
MLPKGTLVLCNGWFVGKVDGMNVRGDYIVAFEEPVRFPTLKIQVERASFCPSLVEEIKE